MIAAIIRDLSSGLQFRLSPCLGQWTHRTEPLLLEYYAEPRLHGHCEEPLTALARKYRPPVIAEEIPASDGRKSENDYSLHTGSSSSIQFAAPKWL
jgi:hypothetical protein